MILPIRHGSLAAAVLLSFSQGASGQVVPPQGPSSAPLAEQVLEGCSSELETYCSVATPGEGRLLACLYAYQDKLSGGCDFVLHDAATRLERAINAHADIASECRAGIERVCAGVQPIAQCLVDNRDDLSASCTKSLADAGLVV